jgi:hypothetical protein
MRRLCAFLLLTASTQACMKWQVAPVAPTLTGERRIRITTAEDRIEVRKPVVLNDTLRGKKGVRVPFASIRRAEVWRQDDVATIAGICVGIVGTVAFVRWIEEWNESWEEWDKAWGKRKT